MNRTTTDSALWDWRYGQTQAERLCADILQVEGFSDIDPQSPLGGPDGRKDILCKRDGYNWLAAVYFPPTRSEFRDIKDKFLYDFEGVEKLSKDRFIFLTNQRLTPGERAQLAKHAEPIVIELYHQERLRSILDSPKGYGLRLEYLLIAMTEEEQHSLWSTLKDDITGRLIRQEFQILDLHRKFDTIIEQTMATDKNFTFEESSIKATQPHQLSQFPTADLQVGDILWIHRILMDGTQIPRENRGRFRNVIVWVGEPGSTPDTARYTSPTPDKVPDLLKQLTERWRLKYSNVSKADEEKRIVALAEFHNGFLSIHPFLDGNGRVARAILQQQAWELMGRYIGASFTDDPTIYYDALSLADAGYLDDLIRLIKVSLE